MNKKFVFLSAFLVIFLLGISFVSASLCRGDDGYWHDCSYYEPKIKYKTDSFKEVVELKKTTTSGYSDKYSSEKITTTISEKTTINRKNKEPYYDYDYFYDYPSYSYSHKYVPSSSWRYKESYHRSDYDDCIDKCIRKSGRNNRERCIDRCRNYNYYYKPRWDYDNQYYNWRW